MNFIYKFTSVDIPVYVNIKPVKRHPNTDSKLKN